MYYELKTTKKLSKKKQFLLLELENILKDTFIGINIHDFRFLKDNNI